MKLATTHQKRLTDYNALFDNRISQLTIDEIRSSTNKAWVMGVIYLNRKLKNLSNVSYRLNKEADITN